MGLVGPAHAERALDQHVALDVAGPGLGERARQREQHRPACQRTPRGAGAQAAPARIEHERARRQQRFDLVEAQRLFAVGVVAARGRSIERAARLGHLGVKRRAPARARRLRRRAPAPCAPRRCAANAARPRPRPAQRRPAATAPSRAHRARRARRRPRRCGRAAAAGAPRSGAPAARSRDRHALRARPMRRRAGVANRRCRASPTRPRPRPPRSAPATAPRGHRSRAQRASAARAPAHARRAAPSRCRAARAPAGLRAGSRA